jgi:tetratricopeptide (TPR) repeat protein
MRAWLLLACVVGGTAAAQPLPERTAEERVAREHYLTGLRLFERKRYREAIVHFRASYELSRQPALLFNLAQASRFERDWSSALHFYQAFLRAAPSTPNRRDVEYWIQEMKRMGPSSEPAPPPAPPAPPTPAPEPEPPRPAGALRWVGVGLAGAGLLLGGTSVFFAWRARTTWDDLNDDPTAPTPPPWTAERQASYQRAEDDERRAWICAGAAVAAAGTGIVLYWLGSPRDAGSPAVTAAPVPGGAAAWLRTSF